MIPMPKVKPSTTGSGIISIDRPMAVRAIRTTSTPAMMASRGTISTPYWAITGNSTTVMAPVGPDTWTWLPPKIAATRPAMIAVTRPAAAPAPDATPKPSASGRATTPTVSPDMRSLAQERRSPR